MCDFLFSKREGYNDMRDVDFFTDDLFLRGLVDLFVHVNIKDSHPVLGEVFSVIGVHYTADFDFDEFSSKVIDYFRDKKWFDVVDFIEFALRVFKRESLNEQQKYNHSVCYGNKPVSVMDVASSVNKFVPGFDGFEYNAFVSFLNDFFVHMRIPFCVKDVYVKRLVLDSVSDVYYRFMINTHSHSANDHFSKAFDVLCSRTDNYSEVGRLCSNGLESLCKELLFSFGGKRKRTVDSDQLGNLSKLLFGENVGVLADDKICGLKIRRLLDSFYAYVNNANVRHGTLDNAVLNFDDARFLFFTTMFIVYYLDSYFDSNGDAK